MPPAEPAAIFVPIADLVPWSRNPRLNDGAPVERVASSIRRFGFTAPVVAWKSRRQIVAGHTRVKAMQALLGEDPTYVPAGCPAVGVVPVRFVEFASQNEADAYALADNRITEATPWDGAGLAAVLRDLSDVDVDLSGLGWSQDELDDIIKATTPDDSAWGAAMGGLPDEDRQPFQQMTFTVHDDQADSIKRALDAAKRLGAFDGPNENSNGNALARICETFLTGRGDG